MVLKVSSNYNHAALNLEEWQDFLDVLCGDREYQKEAIKTALVFLASGEYDMNKIAEVVTDKYINTALHKEKVKSVMEVKRNKVVNFSPTEDDGK